jgi:hypothetical protein
MECWSVGVLEYWSRRMAVRIGELVFESRNGGFAFNSEGVNLGEGYHAVTNLTALVA